MKQQSKDIQSFLNLVKMVGSISTQKSCEEDEKEFCLTACENCSARALAKSYVMPTEF